MRKLWTTAHSIALGVLLGVSLMTAMIWYAVPARAQSTPSQVTIPIANPSFEEGTLFPWYCGARSYAVAGWTYYHATIAAPSSPRPSSCEFSNPPDGKQMAIINDGFVSQDLGDLSAILPHDVNGETNGVLTLRFFVANYFYWYRGHYSASLLLEKGTAAVTLCSTSGWGRGDFTEVTLTCPNQRNSGHLILKLESSGAETFVPNFPGVPTRLDNPMLFDNVSLTFAPEGNVVAATPPPSTSFVWTMPGFGKFTFPMALPPDCSDGTCLLVACNATTNICVTLAPGNTGSFVIRKPTGDTTIVVAGP